MEVEELRQGAVSIIARSVRENGGMAKLVERMALPDTAQRMRRCVKNTQAQRARTADDGRGQGLCPSPHSMPPRILLCAAHVTALRHLQPLRLVYPPLPAAFPADLCGPNSWPSTSMSYSLSFGPLAAPSNSRTLSPRKPVRQPPAAVPCPDLSHKP